MPTFVRRTHRDVLAIVVAMVTLLALPVRAAITPPEGNPSTYNPIGVTLEQGLPSGYVEGEDVEISVEIGVPGTAGSSILALGLEQELPDGWTYARMGQLISGKLPDIPPNGVSGSDLAFAWVTTSAAFPYHFTYFATPSGDQSEPLSLRGQVQYRTSGPAQYSDIATLVLDLGADNEPPVITLAGGDIVVIERGDPYVDPGWTATDNVDGDITGQVEVEGLDVLDPNTIGEYALTYRVADSAGNNALPKTRTVNVVKPQLTLKELFGCGPIDRDDASGAADVFVVLMSTVVVLGAAYRASSRKKSLKMVRGR